MSSKLLGLHNKAILKKSNYYLYLIGAFIGIGAVVFGIGGLIFILSDTYKGMILFQESNIEYLKSMSQKIHDPKLMEIANSYEISTKILDGLNWNFGWLFVLLGLQFIFIFFLFRKLRKKLLQKTEKEQ